MRSTQTIEPIEEAVLQAESDLIPITLIALEVGEPVDRIAHRFGDDVVLDDIGMRSVRADAAREYFTQRAERKARLQEDARRRQEEAVREPRPTLVGAPAQQGMTPYESLVAAAGLVTPDEEFSGREKPNFLEDQLAAGRAAAEKQRRVRQTKKDLS